MEGGWSHHSEHWFLSPVARVVLAPDSHLLLYTPPLTATAKLLVTCITGETQIPFCIVNIQEIQTTLLSPNHSRVIDCTLLTEHSSSPLHSQSQFLLSEHYSTLLCSYRVGEFSEDDLRAPLVMENRLWQESVSPSEASIRLLETALFYSCDPPHRKQSQRALRMPLNHLNRCCYYRNEVLLLAAFTLSCCSLKAHSSAITKPGWKHSRIFCRVSLPHLASWASCNSHTAVKI